MGNTDSNASIKALHMNYLVIRNIKDDPRYGEGWIVKQKQTKQEAFQKEINLTDEDKFKKFKVMLEKKESNKHENLINVTKLYFHEESQFCGQFFQIYILLEYIPQSLKEIIEKRFLNKSQFKEKELMQILKGCIEALFVLQSQNITHQAIRPETISYSEQQSTVKLTDPTVSGVLSSFQLVVQEELKQINQCFLSPQLMQSLNDEVQPQHNPYKSDVYSLGMTMLYLSTLNNCNDCYDIPKLKVLVQQVQRRLQQMETSYSSQYVSLLKRMLLLNEDQRPDFIQLKYELQASQPSQCYEEEQVIQIQKAPIVQVQAYEQVMETNPIQLQSVQMVRQSEERSNLKIQPSIRNSQIQKSQELRQSQYSNQSIYIDGSEVKELRPDLCDHIKILPLSEQIAEPSRIDDNIGNQIGIEHFIDITHEPDQQQVLMPVTSFETSQQYEQFLEMQQSKSNYNDQSQQVDYNMRQINSSNNKRIEYEKVIELYPNGSKYEGEKQNGVREGYGIFLFQDNGGIYEGQWHDNKMHGIGTLFYASGKPAYEGQWFNDKFQGKGTLYNEEPQMSFSEFDYGDFDQVGEYWTKYIGQFNDDNKEGLGTLYLSNGEKFEGNFIQDLISGFGRYVKANGQVVQGRWWRNKLQK